MGMESLSAISGMRTQPCARGHRAPETEECKCTARLPELLAEITALLDWAHTKFGALRGPVETGGLWDYDLQCERDGLPLLALGFDIHERQIHPRPQSQPQAWVTLTLSLSGGPAFAAAFVDRFGAA